MTPDTLSQALDLASPPPEGVWTDGQDQWPLDLILRTSCLGGHDASLHGKSVLLAVGRQIEAALALVALDGVARRIVLLPPDVKLEQLPAIIRDAAVDAIVCSDPGRFSSTGLPAVRVELERDMPRVSMPPVRTEWLMLTSGTSGDPKIAIHTLQGLTGAIPTLDLKVPLPIWATFYDIRRYGGLQIYLRAVLAGASLVLSEPGEAVADYLMRLKKHGVTYISGTPTHWRRVLMSKCETGFAPDYIRLSGEIVDQAVLDRLRAVYPAASIGHAYASTEAGVGFDVNDGLEGFPASYFETPRNGVELRIVDDCLQLRSNRRALGYAGRPDLVLADAEGWVDSGDMVELRNGRCHFIGRRSGVINVGGLKVHPEEIESLLTRHGAVRQAKVRARKSPIIGAIVVADVVLGEKPSDNGEICRAIIAHCAAHLPPHKVPAMINVVPAIDMTAGGKVSRQNA